MHRREEQQAAVANIRQGKRHGTENCCYFVAFVPSLPHHLQAETLERCCKASIFRRLFGQQNRKTYICIMKALHILTPVKDSIETTLETIRAVEASSLNMPHRYVVYNDFSTPENTLRLEEEARRGGFTLVNLSDLTTHPSPNYLLVLQTAQREALAEDAAICIVESDVTVQPHTLQQLWEGAKEQPDCGIAAAVTVDEAGQINYPYLYAQGRENQVFETRKHCSFCCSLLTPELLRRYDFGQLNAEKNWFDVTISHEANAQGLRNYLFTTLPVLHRPHQSRPWKQLKYKNPLKYYWLKFTKGLDKI